MKSMQSHTKIIGESIHFSVIFIFMLLIAISCSPPAEKNILTLRQDCEGVGMVFGILNVTTMEIGCGRLTTDAGKKCQSSFECENGCILNSSTPLAENITGECYAWTVYPNCRSFVEEGKRVIAPFINWKGH